MPPLEYRSIAVKEATKARFDAEKRYPRESADDELNRIFDELLELRRLHSTSEEAQHAPKGGASSTHTQGENHEMPRMSNPDG